MTCACRIDVDFSIRYTTLSSLGWLDLSLPANRLTDIRWVHKEYNLEHNETLTASLRSPGWLECISPDIAQSMMYAIGSIYDIIKVLFCFRHSIPSNYYHDARLLAGVEHRNVCRVYPAESVSKMEISRLPLCILWGCIWQPQKWRNAINRNFL